MSIAPRSVQRAGADPAVSAFVMANAGSGKTRVLIERVARLLLQNADPKKILCITFTKAAASEMSERLFDVLGKWTLLDDDALQEALGELSGDDEAHDLRAVRRLFARALETPGGLKIQTIHAFCESILKAFPLEAGVSPGFSIIEDAETRALVENAIDATARQSGNDEHIQASIDRLARLKNETDIRSIVRSAVTSTLTAFPRANADPMARLAERLNIDPSHDANTVIRAFLAGVDHDQVSATRDVLASGSKSPRDHAERLSAFLAASTEDDQWRAIDTALFAQTGTPRKRIFTKGLAADFPDAVDHVNILMREFAAARQRVAAHEIYANTHALYTFEQAVRAHYTTRKSELNALDFNDLIIGAYALLTRESAAWVRYKLGFGIDHILIDETQDTSPQQWKIIEALTADYLSGGDSREVFRTFFAVGDVKQSIYSFQGADADVFQEKEETFGKALAAYHGAVAGEYKNIQMQTSFRTTAPILKFVDVAFDDVEIREGLGRSGVPKHIAYRRDDAGLVELWPLAPRLETPAARAWDAPINTAAPSEPVRKLCDRVAAEVARWLRDGEMLASKDRPIEPNDILILVQRRGPAFRTILQALAKEGAPVAGADRIQLRKEPAVLDLISYAKFVVQAGDDLSLAEVLKCPLFSFDDDCDLYPLAHERAADESLWASLSRRADEKPLWRAARDEIAQARAIGVSHGPFAFFSFILETAGEGDDGSGRKRFHRRLSEASRDAIDELLRQALVFEQANPPSLQIFLHWFTKNAGDIKREPERTSNAVRVMTVHGAKGLEANIVFLLDAHSSPNLQSPGVLLPIASGDDAIAEEDAPRALVGAAIHDVDATSTARELRKRKAYEEYRRLFYVAATRARDRLYICGAQSGASKDPRKAAAAVRTWHAIAADAFDRLADDVEKGESAFWEDGDDVLLRMSQAQRSEPSNDEGASLQTPDTETPAWLFAPVPKEERKKRVAPSRLADDEATGEAAPPAPAAYSPRDADRYFRGSVLHRLLETLPDVDIAKRSETAQNLIALMAPDLDAAEGARWRDEVLTVLRDGAFAEVFSPQSRAEVALSGEIDGVVVSGQIDRLIVHEDRALAVDYKTNRPPPVDVEDTPPAYLAQMAAYRALLQEIYRDHQVECAILWTFDARLTPLPAAMLDDAYQRWIAAG